MIIFITKILKGASLIIIKKVFTDKFIVDFILEVVEELINRDTNDFKRDTFDLIKKQLRGV